MNKLEKEIQIFQNIATNLDLSHESCTSMQQQTLSYINGFYQNQDNLPAYNPEYADKEDYLLKIGPAYKFEELIEFMKEKVFHIGVNSSRGDLSYIPMGGLHTSALADYLTSVFNKCCCHHFSAPGAIDMEQQLIRWSADLFGFPATALGNITTGGSVANLIAVTTARDAACIMPEDIRRCVIYITTQTHSSILKAIKIAGLSQCIIRNIAIDESFRMRPEHLKSQMATDAQSGLKPFLVVATCGTTDTGAIDPLEEIADVCQEHKVWLHVDGAYGGFFILVPEIKDKMKGIERADSISLDPHKTLFLPFGCSIVLVRDGRKLYNTFHVKANYFVHDSSDTWDEHSPINPTDLSPEMSRPLRGLKLWLPLLLHGVKPFSACLSEKLLLTKFFHEQVQKMGFTVGPEPDLTICIHRFIPNNEHDANEYNEKLMEAIRSDRRVYVSSTVIDGVFWIRAAILQYRTHLPMIKLYLSLLEKEVRGYTKGCEIFKNEGSKLELTGSELELTGTKLEWNEMELTGTELELAGTKLELPGTEMELTGTEMELTRIESDLAKTKLELTSAELPEAKFPDFELSVTESTETEMSKSDVSFHFMADARLQHGSCHSVHEI